MLAKKPKGAVEKRRKSSSLSGFLWMLVGAILTLMILVALYLFNSFDFFSPVGGSETTTAERQVQPKVETDTDNGDYEFYDVLPNQEMATIPDESVAIDDEGIETVPNTFEPDAVVTQPRVEPRADSNSNLSIQEQTTLSSQADGVQSGADDNQIVVVEEDTTYDGDDNVPAATTNNSSATASISAATPDSAGTRTYILQINSFGSADEADRRRAQVLMAGVDANVVKKMTGNGQPLYQVISRPMSNRQAVISAQQRLQNNGIDSLIVEQRR